MISICPASVKSDDEEEEEDDENEIEENNEVNYRPDPQSRD